MLDLNVLKLLFHSLLLDLNVHIWRCHRILWTSMSIIELEKFLAGGRGTAAATATATSQQLWTSGGALVQRAQEPNIPCRQSLTSMIENICVLLRTFQHWPNRLVGATNRSEGGIFGSWARWTRAPPRFQSSWETAAVAVVAVD